MNEFDLIDRYFGRCRASIDHRAGPGRQSPRHASAHRESMHRESMHRDAPAPGSSRVHLGIGDDCALLDAAPGLLAVSSDMLVEGRHFFRGADPASLGHKALAVNLSDLAAMGAEPLGFTLAIALPSIDEDWLGPFSAGLLALADRSRCPLVGGDTTRGPLTISITVMGLVDRGLALRRDGARAGDDVWVSGRLGGAAWAVAERSRELQVQADPAGRANEMPLPSVLQRSGPGRTHPAHDDAAARHAHDRLDRPEPRLALGRRLRGLASSAIDVSDGLAGDVRHLLQASAGATGTALHVRLDEAALPFDAVLDRVDEIRQRQLALHGGDDYELLFTAQPRHRDAIAALDPMPTRIGTIQPSAQPDESGVVLLTCRDGTTAVVQGRGYDHFETT